MATQRKTPAKRQATKDAAPRERKPLIAANPAHAAVAHAMGTAQVEEREVGDMVTALVPKKFTLTLDDHRPVVYEPGTQEMPREDAEHWFSKAMGVEIYEPKKR